MSASVENPTGPTLDPAERAARFNEGPPKMSRRAIWIVIGIIAVLGIGGAFADHSFNVPSSAPPSTTVLHSKAVKQTLAEFVNLSSLGHSLAPPIRLVDQHGAPFNLRALNGRVVVLTFLDARCGDICPVVSNELREATSDLGALARSTSFVVVNANPGHLGTAATQRAVRADRLGTLPNLFFVSGPLATMNKVWAAYGVTVEYDPTTGRLGHTNLIDIIAPNGTLDYSLGPFGNENFAGQFTLSAPETSRFARGIAEFVKQAAS